jgi:hypothetical protein
MVNDVFSEDLVIFTLVGESGVGKTPFAEQFIESWPSEKGDFFETGAQVIMANQLKEFCASLIGVESYLFHGVNEEGKRLQDIAFPSTADEFYISSDERISAESFDFMQYELCCNNLREFLIVVANRMKKHFNEDIFIHNAIKEIETHSRKEGKTVSYLIIPDLRFDCEWNYLKERFPNALKVHISILKQDVEKSKYIKVLEHIWKDTVHFWEFVHNGNTPFEYDTLFEKYVK